MLGKLLDHFISTVDCCPWVAHAHPTHAMRITLPPLKAAPFCYTAAERRRRDASPWTLVQGILAPLQFLAFGISLGFVLHFLLAGQGLQAATISVLVKTFFLIAIMVTGAIWEHDVFGQYLFAPAFFWEDVFSFLVIGLHTVYVVVLFTGAATPRTQMLIALAAYVSYVINAGQFLLKMRAARLTRPAPVSQELHG